VRRRTARLLAIAVCAAARAAPCAAQVEAGVDAAASWIKYEGFLGSGAASVSPSLAWRSVRTTLTARGTFLVFESGNTSIQGLVAGSAFSPPAGPLRVEALGEAGASSYVGFARFAHLLGRLRVHALGGPWGAWAGPLLGTVSIAGVAHGATGLEAGAWTRWSTGALELAWTRVAVADTAYDDFVARARWQPGALDLSGAVGSRAAGRGGAPSSYGELSVALRLTGPVALIASAGEYPSDPVGGSVAGRYVTAGLRLARQAARRPAVVRAFAAPAPVPAPPPSPVGAAVSVERHGDLAVLVVRADGARLVELMGDFTSWQPVALEPGSDGRWRFETGLTTGMYRFNVRVDGGPWGVPTGVAAAADEFGGSVGVVVVP